MSPSGFELANLSQIELPEDNAVQEMPSGWDIMSDKDRDSKIMESLLTIGKGANETRNALVSVIPTVNAQTRILKNHEDRIASVEKKSKGSAPQPTNELVIDNLPLNCCVNRSAKDIGVTLLRTLNLSDLESDVLSVKEFKRNNNDLTLSLTVAFKSNYTRDHVVNTKRKFGPVKRNMILDQDAGDEPLYINELLPLDLHRLHMAAKQHKARMGWVGYIWVQNSRILAGKGQIRKSFRNTVVRRPQQNVLTTTNTSPHHPTYPSSCPYPFFKTRNLFLKT